nr:hypothetical protein [Sphingomonas sp. Y57]
MSDPVKAIARHLRHCCAPFAELVVDRADSEDWHSLLFDGGRHHLDVRLRGDDVAMALDALPAWIAAADFTIAGHLIADITLVSVERRDKEALLRLEALTLADSLAVSV